MHTPVLLKETLEYLNVNNGTKFIDGTVGSGGHATAILKTNPRAQVLGIDLDQTALEKLQGLGITLVNGNYSNLNLFAEQFGFDQADGVLLDLGFSSTQIDDPLRGFSFQADGPLDMRYSRDNVLTARKVINEYTKDELIRVLKDFGEEKFAGRLAQSIVNHRQARPIDSTMQLAKIIGHPDSVRRVFQALRIEVNQELENLTEALPKALKVLKSGGRLVVISFHSLEDRIVKEFFNNQAKDCVCPPEFPTCICDKVSTLRILTRKLVTESQDEVKNNPRSKPAKLRAGQKI